MLAMSRLRAGFEFQVRAIAPAAANSVIVMMSSRESDISANTTIESVELSRPVTALEYTMSRNTAPKYATTIQT